MNNWVVGLVDKLHLSSRLTNYVSRIKLEKIVQSIMIMHGNKTDTEVEE